MLLLQEIQKTENHCPHQSASLWKAVQVELAPPKGLRLFLHVICSQILMKTNVPSHCSQLTERMV